MLRYFSYVLCVGVLITLVVVSSSCTRSGKAASTLDPPATTVAVAKAARGPISRDLVIAAEFKPYQEIEVHAKVAGYVKAIYVDVGDHVKQNQLLAVLEVPELVAQGDQAEAAVKHAEAEIQREESEVQRSEYAHEVSHLAYNRLAAVIKTRPNLVAQQDIDDAQGKDKVSEAQMTTARAALLSAKEQLSVAKANQEQVRTLLAYTRITAPFTGIITKRYADLGAMVQAGIASQTQTMPLVRLAQNDTLRLTIPVPETAVPLIHIGMDVAVDVPALKRRFTGTVSRFADQLDLATRTMHTEVDVKNPTLQLVPGMYASTVISLDKKADALTVPVQAILRNEDRTSVLAVDAAHKIEERPVTLGIQGPSAVEVTSGLKEGDLVVIANQSQFSVGQIVEPKLASIMVPKE